MVSAIGKGAIMDSKLPPDSFDSVIADYHPKLLAYFRRRVNDPHIAYDLTADVEVRVWRAWCAGMPQQIPTRADFEIWLYTIAKHCVIDDQRKQQRRPPSISLDTATIHTQLIWAHDAIDDQIIVRRALAALAPRDRYQIELLLDGYTSSEIARLLSVQPAAERRARQRIFRRIRANLESSSPAQHIAYGDAFGVGAILDGLLATAFERKSSIQVNVIAKPASATDSFAMMRHAFQVRDNRIAIYTMDVGWQDAFAPHLVNLEKHLNINSHDYATNVLCPSNKGHYNAIPLHRDWGMIYYRVDLLQHYGYATPPATWAELEAMVQTILAGERARGNHTLTGYIFQCAPYEGLVCHLLELLASQGGGTIIENGRVTLNNSAAIQAIKRTRGWIGTLAPPEVLTWTEEDTRRVFQQGDAIFMRNWPYGYRMLKADPAFADRFAVAPLPHNPGLPSVATLGGSQLGVSRYTNDNEMDSALAFVEYMTSPQAQKLRALAGSYIPTLTSIQRDPAVLRAIPYLPAFDDVKLIVRPSAEIGARYSRVSTLIVQQLHRIMRGADVAQTVADLASSIQRLIAARPSATET